MTTPLAAGRPRDWSQLVFRAVVVFSILYWAATGICALVAHDMVNPYKTGSDLAVFHHRQNQAMSEVLAPAAEGFLVLMIIVATIFVMTAIMGWLLEAFRHKHEG